VIVGIGVDIGSLERWQAMAERRPRAVEMVLTDQEKARPLDSQAARFAAKEALIKALGGPEGLRWHDAEVVVADSGSPSFELRGSFAEHCQARGVDRIHLSISHDAGAAVAFVILEGT
jgi:holo-[acyl-carrier protein] synthase